MSGESVDDIIRMAIEDGLLRKEGNKLIITDLGKWWLKHSYPENDEERYNKIMKAIEKEIREA